MNHVFMNRTTLALTKKKKNLFKRVICSGIGTHWLSCIFLIHSKGSAHKSCVHESDEAGCY